MRYVYCDIKISGMAKVLIIPVTKSISSSFTNAGGKIQVNEAAGIMLKKPRVVSLTL